MDKKDIVLAQLDQFRGNLEEYLATNAVEAEQLKKQLEAKDFVEITEEDQVSDEEKCMVCQKAINQLEGAYLVGDQYWVCSTGCEQSIEIRPTIKFTYR